jgi:hypothetical protein
MINTKFIILFAIFCFSSFAQDATDTVSGSKMLAVLDKDSNLAKIYEDRWSLEIGGGISIGTRPFTEGYGMLSNNRLLNGFNVNSFTIGSTYNSSKFISYKLNFSFDQFTNSASTTSKPFESIQYRSSLQGQINVSRLTNLNKDHSDFNVLVHAGIQVSRLKPVPLNFNTTTRYSSGDNQAGFTMGITSTYQILKKLKLFADLSSFNNYGQNLTWNGLGSQVSNNALGHMYSVSAGLSLGIDPID